MNQRCRRGDISFIYTSDDAGYTGISLKSLLKISIPILSLVKILKFSGSVAMRSIRRITATPLPIKAENVSLDTPEMSVFPASIYSTPLDFWLNLPASTAFLAFQPGSGNRPTGNLSFCCCAV
jgi:hypothetical protein